MRKLRVCVKPAAGTSPTNRPDALLQLGGRELTTLNDFCRS